MFSEVLATVVLRHVVRVDVRSGIERLPLEPRVVVAFHNPASRNPLALANLTL